MNRKLVQLVIVACFVYLNSAVNILVLEEVASPSHHVWYRSLNQGLAKKGYNVTVLSPDKDVSLTNLHYIHMDQVYERLYNDVEAEEINFIDMGDKDPYGLLTEFGQFSEIMCYGQVTSNGWKELENYPSDFKFDLIIYDYIMGGCLIAFANKFQNVPIVGATAFNDNFRANSFSQHPVVPSISPFSFYNINLETFLGRTLNFIMHMADKIVLHYDIIPKITEMIKKTTSFKNTPSMLELGARTVLFLTNYDPSVDGIQQIPPNVIPAGGLQIKPANKLLEDFQVIADSATYGLVLFSLGTNVQGEMLGDERIKAILEAFRKLPKYIFLWKVSLDKFPVPLPSNVVVRKWVPQNEILAHKNTKLFITHAGLLSTQESIYYGVPMLGIPIFADQFVNIRRSVAKGVADVLYIKDLSTDTLHTKVTNLLTQSKYRKQIQLASAAFRDQKETPLERALWWIEWVIRNPNANHFRAQHNLNFLQLESFDVIAFIIVVALLTVYGCVRFVKTVSRCICGERKSSKRKTE
ncbi:UDP-glycosyltransferase UGT5 [Pseudolycoriella hygida]|uniref:UDP-glucuronosyltransferase n=1 Tax=Pseudolycoriella hygida TaxID=35572 RepID=A0A9Q0S5Q8_9DIPT|nr:UDP-glycosyltransferase UGT5 [Pseudolycoriella hygida]